MNRRYFLGSLIGAAFAPTPPIQLPAPPPAGLTFPNRRVIPRYLTDPNTWYIIADDIEIETFYRRPVFVSISRRA